MDRRDGASHRPAAALVDRPPYGRRRESRKAAGSRNRGRYYVGDSRRPAAIVAASIADE